MIKTVIRTAFSVLLLVLCVSTVSASEYRVLAVRVDFTEEIPDHETTSGIGTFDLRDYTNDAEVQEQYHHPWDVPPHNRTYFENHLDALSNYWNTVSDGSITITHDIWPHNETGAYTMGNTFYKYGNGRTDEQTYEKLAGLVKEALDALKAAEGDAVDISQYDTVMIIHAGIGSETSGMLNDIPSAYLSVDDFESYLDGPLFFDGTEIEHALVLPEMTSGSGYAGLNGIMAQMFGFRLGLPSLSNNKTGIPGAGGWSLMDVGGMAWGYRTLGFIPTHPIIWSKIELGLIDPVHVSTDTTMQIAATHISNGLPRGIRIDITDDEYLLIENRFSATPHDSLPPGIVFSDGDSTGVWTSVSHYDAFIPGSGVLIWHITDSIIDDFRNRNAVNNDPFRRGVDLLEADGIQDIGALFGFGDNRTEYSIGHDDDTYKSNGTATISPTTNPHTGSIWGGSSGVTVTVTSEPGVIADITISFTGKLPGFPIEMPGARQLTALDLDEDGIDELVVSTVDSFTVINSHGEVADPVASGSHPPLTTDDEIDTHPQLFTHTIGSQTYYVYRDGTILPTLDAVLDVLPGTTYADGPAISLNSNGHYIPYMNLRTFAPNGTFVGNTYFGASGSISIPDSTWIVSAGIAQTTFSALTASNTLAIGILGESPADSYDIHASVISAPLLVDIDRDDKYETVITADRELLIYKSSGSNETVTLFDTSVGDPVAADIDRDGYPEIIIATRSGVTSHRADGAVQPGFPFTLPPGNDTEYITSSPIIADLDNDGRLDIACATSSRRMLSFDPDGLQTAGFPIALAGEITTSPCIFRYDTTGMMGIAYITTTGLIGAYDLDVMLDDADMPWPMWRGGPGLSGAYLNESITAPVQSAASFEAFCYPNPITDAVATFRIIPADETDVTIGLYTIDGGRIFEIQRSADTILPGVINDIPFNTSELASGLYVAKIETRQKTVFYKVGVQK